MKEERFFYVPNAAECEELPEVEAQHAIRVLRLAEGDGMFLMDGVGTFYRAVITMATKKRCFYQITDVIPQKKSWHGHIHLAIAPTKMMERMEWMVEKAVEVGVDEISFIDCRFSERQSVRIDRLEKIVVSAMKQSRKPFKPILNELADFSNFIDRSVSEDKPCANGFIAHCYDDVSRSYLFDDLKDIPVDGNVTILVGPEGDFSVEEVRLAMSRGYKSITLGKSRLRTETAGLIAVTMAQIQKSNNTI